MAAPPPSDNGTIFSGIVCGFHNNITVSFSFIGSGTNNQIHNNPFSFIGCGNGNNITSNITNLQCTTIINGMGNTASGSYSTIINGQNASDHGRTGWQGFSTGSFGQIGDQQVGLSILSGSVSGTNPLILTAGNVNNVYTAPNTTNILNLLPYSVLRVKGSILLVDTKTQSVGSWDVDFVIKQGINAAATSIVGTPVITSTAIDTEFSTVTVTVVADTTNGGPNITLTNSAAWTNLAYAEASVTVTELIIPAI